MRSGRKILLQPQMPDERMAEEDSKVEEISMSSDEEPDTTEEVSLVLFRRPPFQLSSHRKPSTSWI